MILNGLWFYSRKPASANFRSLCEGWLIGFIVRTIQPTNQPTNTRRIPHTPFSILYKHSLFRIYIRLGNYLSSKYFIFLLYTKMMRIGTDLEVVDSLLCYSATIACFWLITYVNVKIGLIHTIIWWTLYTVLAKVVSKFSLFSLDLHPVCCWLCMINSPMLEKGNDIQNFITSYHFALK